MNNEIGRKLTSLTLMTIMLAGGMVIAAPSMVPEAAAAGQLYVSAENAQFGNTFGGAQIIEVIVRDPNRADTEVSESEPLVYVDNNQLRMAQGVDGYWYAYIGSDANIQGTAVAYGTSTYGTVAADATDNNLNYGADADGTTPNYVTGLGQHHNGAAGANIKLTGVHGAKSMFISTNAGVDMKGVVTNPPTLSDYNHTDNTGGDPKSSNADQSSTLGQIGVNATEWPFIQTFDLTQGTFDIVLAQAGADEVVTLDFNSADLDDFAFLTLDRTSGTQGSEIHLEITDNQLNIDPTNEDIVVFDTYTGNERVSFTNGTQPSGNAPTDNLGANGNSFSYLPWSNDFSDNGVLIINNNTNSAAFDVLKNDATLDDLSADLYKVFYEGADNSGVFYNTDDADDSSIIVNPVAKRGTTATFNYNDDAQSYLVTNFFGEFDMDETSVGTEWNSGETLAVTLVDQDINKNTWSGDDMALSTHNSTIPSLQIGSPTSLSELSFFDNAQMNISSFNKIGTLVSPATDSNPTSRYSGVAFNSTTVGDMRTAITNADYTLINYDLSALTSEITGITLVGNSSAGSTALMTVEATTLEKGLVLLDNSLATVVGTLGEGDNLIVNFTTPGGTAAAAGESFYVDIFTFGDGNQNSDSRINNAIYRLALDETGDNTGIFEGDVEYVMLNQLNADDSATYTGLTTFGSSIIILVNEDLTDEDSPRINYIDLGTDGVATQIGDQVAAPTHSGTVSFDATNYKTADTVVVTLDDQDLNTDSGLIDVYITKDDDKVGNGGFDHVLDITFNDHTWKAGTVDTDLEGSPDNGLYASGFTLVETDLASGIFVGSFQVPATYWNDASGVTETTAVTTTGTDIEVNYNDHRDASGETIEVGAGASVNANTGSVSFDRNVYPVPWGNVTAAGAAGEERFQLHSSALNLNSGSYENALAQGDVTVHIRISDPDYDVSAFGEDTIADTTVVLKIERAGGVTPTTIATFGTAALPIKETSPTSGVFEYDQAITFTSGPAPASGVGKCPTAFDAGCVLQGDILTVTYNDLKDASGQAQSVTDSATFDLRNGVLQADKSVYLIGSDMILTLIEPDFDRDNDGAESYTLDLIEWDSDADTTTMGLKGTSGANAAFDPEPSKLRETGDSTGIFQVVIEIPDTLNSNGLDRGEKIDLEYTDWGPAGADYVGQEDEDIGLTVYTSNFGATIELDQKVYTWTDKVYITIVAPDHNFDSNLVDEIGNTSSDPVKVATRGNALTTYKLVESGADTGIFIGEVTLGGFEFDADGDGNNDITAVAGGADGEGPTSGKLATTDNDGLTVSFEFSEDETVVGSALIRWNVGEVQWLEASYPASGTGVIRVIDADMNLNPEAIDNFSVDAWSDSDAGGIDLTVTETNEATGIFEGTVFFTTANDSSGHRLRVAEGDTVTAEYEDNTLPEPYTTADELDITATTLIGTIVPPLERAPAANLRTVDAFGNSLNSVSVDQQVQVAADIANGQDREQAFAYLVQIQDGDGVTVSLAWITGSLSAGQSFSPALSWIPTESGSYTATAFVWESVDNPTALSPPVSTTISVQ